MSASWCWTWDESWSLSLPDLWRWTSDNSEYSMSQDHTLKPMTCLQVRKKNILKDFVAVAGPLGISHFSIFTKTENSVNMVSIFALWGQKSLYFLNAYIYSCCEKYLCLYFSFFFYKMSTQNNICQSAPPPSYNWLQACLAIKG